jgi:hypothetical protein
VQRQYSGTAGRTENPPAGVPPARSASSPPTPPAGAGRWWTGNCTCRSPGHPIRTAVPRRRSPAIAPSPPRVTWPKSWWPGRWPRRCRSPG